MQIDEFLELVRKRRTIRRFKPDPVPDDYIAKMIEAASWAASGGNAQPWEFIVVKDRETRHKIAELYMEQVKETWQIEKTRIEELRLPMYKNGPHTGPGGSKIEDAPVFIVVCGDPRTLQASVLSTHFIPNEGGPMAHFYKNIANAIQILMLAGAVYGLGTQWVSISRVTESYLRALLDIPEELTIPTIVPVGYPAYIPPSRYQRKLEEIIHFEEYDRSKFRSSEDIFQWLRATRQEVMESYKAARK